MNEEKWIEFGLSNNNTLFVPIENKTSLLSEAQLLKLEKKNKESIIKFMKKNIDSFNYLYKIGFEIIDDYSKTKIKIKRLMKKFDNYNLYVDVEVDFRANGVCYLQITVDNKSTSYGYIFDDPNIKYIDWALEEIKEKDNNRYFLRPLI